MRCYRDHETGIHIPCCLGCAVYGHDRCTCPSKREEAEALSRRVAILERKVAALEHPHGY